MFILPALLYLKVLPLFGQFLYHFIIPNKSRPPHAGPLPALHPSWVGRVSVSTFTPHQREDVWPPKYDVACPIRGGYSGKSGVEPGTLRTQSRELTTRPKGQLKKLAKKKLSKIGRPKKKVKV
ncbi:hypothetical protein AVEN_198544-1 [Araneus ventricosus]|uniref:Uncharacterized protein n=1 Tax=Araneus ventricosus TaxID=182803 RepID=A0A4Y2HY04_ARAVE|nr:hypothetical protein AVEN_198544-1 [Araneus ventricosus]